MIYLEDPDVTIHQGDALTVLQGIPDGSVDCCVTSPPYWGLRDYGTPGQLGLEATPDEYVAAMVDVFREVRRVLKDSGTLWLNMGDSYCSTAPGTTNAPGQLGAGSGRGRREATQLANWRAKTPDGMKPKDLVGIPWMLAFALRADGWYLRSDIIWFKNNPMPESVTDRPTKAHEYVFLLSKSSRYFFDQEAVREPHSPDGRRKTVHDHLTDASHPNYDNIGNGNERWPNGGRNVRSVWEIATQPFPEAHFATFPEELVRRCILAGTSERGVCPECGAPWERETETEYDAKGRTTNGPRSLEQRHETDGFATRLEKRVETTGWRASCGHDVDPVPAVVLDPFMGSGTTGLVARKHGRRAIGVELSADYCELASRRLAQQSLFAGAV